MFTFVSGASRLHEGPQRSRAALESLELQAYRSSQGRLREHVQRQQVSARRHGMVSHGRPEAERKNESVVDTKTETDRNSSVHYH